MLLDGEKDVEERELKKKFPLEFEVEVEGEYVPGNEFFWNAIEARTEPAIPEHIKDFRIFLGEGESRVDITDCFPEGELIDIECEVIARIKEPREE